MAQEPQNAVHSIDGKIVTLFGGGGFVGRHIAQALMQAGARVRIVQRHPERAAAVRSLGNLGQLQLVSADITKAAHVHKAVTGSDIVINAVGSFDNLMAVQADGAAHVAQAAAAAGVTALVHVSAIGASSDSPSHYGRSKAAGEAAVFAAFPNATIIRPSIIFGRQDQFINRFAGLIASLPIVPIIAPTTRFQPVFVGDVARAVVAAAHGGTMVAGQCFEAGGPRTIAMRDLLIWIAGHIGRTPMFVELPDAAAAAMATLTGWMPGAPITRDQWAMLGQDNVVGTGAKGLNDLGITATDVDAVASGWLDIYRTHGRFAAKTAPSA